MTARTELMIGDFARRSRLPVSTLRYYDRIGLLIPAVVDQRSRYRRYAVDQLPTAVRISRLRSLGIPPDSIARILTGTPAAAIALVRERQRIAAGIELGRERLRRLDELLAEDTTPIDHRVEIVALAAREVAARRFLLPVSELESGVTRMIAGLRAGLRRGGVRREGAWGATFPVELDDEVSGFVFAQVGDGQRGDLDTAWLPKARAVTTVHRGGPACLPLAYHAAFAAIEDLGATAAGPVIEEYTALDDPGASTPSIRVRIPFHGQAGTDQPARR